MAKRDAAVTAEINQSIRTLTFHTTGCEDIVLHLERMNAALIDYAAYDRLRNRVIDAAAIPFNGERYATPSEKYEAMAELVSYLESGAGEWSRRATGSVRSEGSLLFQAISRLRRDRTAAQIRIFLGGMSKAEQMKLLNSDKVRPIADAIRAEGAQGIDSDELLSGL